MAQQNGINFAAATNNQFAVGLTSSGPNALDVSGGVAIGASYAGSITAPTNGLIVQGAMGIGASSPTTLLDIASTSTAGTLSACALQNFNTTAAVQKGSSLIFETKDSGGTTRTQGSLRYLTITTDALQSYASIITTNTAYTGVDVIRLGGEAAVFLGNGCAVFPSGFDAVGNTYSKRGFASGGVEIGWDITNSTGHIVSTLESSAPANLFIRAFETRFYIVASTTATVTLRPSRMGILTATPLNALDVNGGCVVGASLVGTVTAGTGALLVENNIGIGNSFISTPTPRASLDVRGSQALNITVPGAYPYSALTTDYLIAVDTTSARSIVLPTAAAGNTGVTYVVKDATGGAVANNITVTVNGGGNIDGGASSVINTAYGAQKYYSNATQWFTAD